VLTSPQPIPTGVFTLPGADAAFVRSGCANVCRFCYLRGRLPGLHCKRRFRGRRRGGALDPAIVLFVDDNPVDRDYASPFRRLAPLRKHWWAQVPTTSPPTRIPDARAGCCPVTASRPPRALAEGERIYQNRIDRYREIVATTQARGILVDGTFIFGFDGDPPSIFDDTVAAVRAMELDTYTFYLLTVYPGTALHARYRDEGRLVTTDLGKYDWDHAIVRPANMTPEELEAGVERAYAALDAAYRRTFLRRALRHARFLLRSPALAKFLPGWPRAATPNERFQRPSAFEWGSGRRPGGWAGMELTATRRNTTSTTATFRPARRFRDAAVGRADPARLERARFGWWHSPTSRRCPVGLGPPCRRRCLGRDDGGGAAFEDRLDRTHHLRIGDRPPPLADGRSTPSSRAVFHLLPPPAARSSANSAGACRAGASSWPNSAPDPLSAGSTALHPRCLGSPRRRRAARRGMLFRPLRTSAGRLLTVTVERSTGRSTWITAGELHDWGPAPAGP
jgi:hypothetical protein